MHKPLLAIRMGRQSDLNDLVDIDIKSFETAWTPERWEEIERGMEYGINVLAYYGTAVGFVVFNSEDGGMRIQKIAIKPQFRGHDGSVLMIASVMGEAQQKRLDHMFIVIPEYQIYPDTSNQSVGIWLNKLGFNATKPLLRNYFNAYGQSEDGVKFVGKIRSAL